MRALWYEKKGKAKDVLKVGTLVTPTPGPDEVLIRMVTSGVLPGDTKKRAGNFSQQMPFPRVIPHCDGAGVIEAVGENVPKARISERVYTYNAQIGRAYGTAAEYCAIPGDQAVHLPDNVDFVQGGTLGLSAITAHRLVFVGGVVNGKTLLISGGAGRVGLLAVQYARWGGATVIATVGSAKDAQIARDYGAHHVINFRTTNVIEQVNALTEGKGVDHIVEVAFDRNIETAAQILKVGGSLSTYATQNATPTFPFWEFIFKNCAFYFVGFDDIPKMAVQAALTDMNTCLEAGLLSHPIAAEFPLEQTSEAHELIESGAAGSVVIRI